MYIQKILVFGKLPVCRYTAENDAQMLSIMI